MKLKNRITWITIRVGFPIPMYFLFPIYRLAEGGQRLGVAESSEIAEAGARLGNQLRRLLGKFQEECS